MKTLYKKDNYQLQEVSIKELINIGLELPPDKQITKNSQLTQQRLLNDAAKGDTFSPISLGVLFSDNLPKRTIILDGYKRYKALLNFNRTFLIEVWSVNSPEELAIKHLEHFSLDSNFHKLTYSFLPYLKEVKTNTKVKESIEFLLGYLFGKPLKEGWDQERFFTVLNLNKVIDRLKNESIVKDFNQAVDYVNSITCDYYTALALISKFGTKLPFTVSKEYVLKLTEEANYSYPISLKADFIYNQL